MAHCVSTLRRPACIAITIVLFAMCSLDSHAQYLYWTGSQSRPTEPNVLRTAYDDSSVEGVVRASGGILGIAINGESLFLASGSPGESTIVRSRLDGSIPTALISTSSPIRALSFDHVAERLYFYDYSELRFVSLASDGSGVQPSPVVGNNDVGSLAVDGENRIIYWEQSGILWRAPLDGGPSEILADPSLGLDIHSVALDTINGHVYWTEWHRADQPQFFGGRIRRSNLDGSETQTILSGLPLASDPGGVNVAYLNPTFLAIDPVANYLFTYNEAFADISRANLDGSNFIDQFIQDEGVLTMRGMAVLPVVSEPSTFALAGVGAVLLAAMRLRTRRRRARGA